MKLILSASVVAIVLVLFVDQISSRDVQSVQDYVNSLLLHVEDKSEALERNPTLLNVIYRYYLQQYPRPSQQSAAHALINEQRRLQQFKTNVKHILDHNQNSASSYKLKINHMTDWTDEEVNQLRSKINVEPLNLVQPEIQSRKSYPTSYDWRNQTRVPGAVTPVKNQGHCGSCYAFGMVGALEKTYAEIYNKSGILSPQELMDCPYEQGGCNGGSFMGTFNYVKQNHDRLNLMETYPYMAVQQKCLAKEGTNTSGVSLSLNSKYKLNYKQLPAGNEEYMKQYLYDNGPLYVYYNAGLREGNDTILLNASRNFDHYASGVYDVPGCPTLRNLNHAPVVVGYGTDETSGLDYWLVKNSWGTSWGLEGYIKIRRGVNMCGIASYPYYAGLF